MFKFDMVRNIHIDISHARTPDNNQAQRLVTPFSERCRLLAFHREHVWVTTIW